MEDEVKHPELKSGPTYCNLSSALSSEPRAPRCKVGLLVAVSSGSSGMWSSVSTSYRTQHIKAVEKVSVALLQFSNYSFLRQVMEQSLQSFRVRDTGSFPVLSLFVRSQCPPAQSHQQHTGRCAKLGLWAACSEGERAISELVRKTSVWIWACVR